MSSTVSTVRHENLSRQSIAVAHPMIDVIAFLRSNTINHIEQVIFPKILSTNLEHVSAKSAEDIPAWLAKHDEKVSCSSVLVTLATVVDARCVVVV